MILKELFEELFEVKKFIRVRSSFSFRKEELHYSVMRESFWKLEIYVTKISEKKITLGRAYWETTNKWEAANGIPMLIKGLNFKKDKEQRIIGEIEGNVKVNLIDLLGGQMERNDSGYETVQRFPRFKKMYKNVFDGKFVEDLEGHDGSKYFAEYYV